MVQRMPGSRKRNDRRFLWCRSAVLEGVIMDLSTCLKKMKLVGVLAFATVDSTGAPQIRNISAIHYEPDALYFFTARGKNSARNYRRMDAYRFCAIQNIKK